MAMNDLMMNATHLVHKAGFVLKKYSPEILLVLGIGGTVGGTVLACRATLKADKHLSDAKCCVKELKAAFSEDEVEPRIKKVRLSTGLKVAKDYAPAILVEGLGVVCLVASHSEMGKRNASLAAAYAAIDQSFKQYRQRVADKIGEDAEEDIRLGSHEKDIVEETIDPETGEVIREARKVVVIDENGYTQFARYFDNNCKGYERNMDYTDMFLGAQEAIARTKLVGDGFLFLNDMYDLLGIDKTAEGQVIGWIYDKNAPTKNLVKRYVVNRETEDGEVEQVVLLDFNVDGYILDRAKKLKLL